MKLLGRAFCYCVLSIAAFLSMFPFYFMFVSGTNTNADILAFPPKITPGGNLAANLETLMTKVDLPTTIANSLFVSVTYTLLAVILFSAAGYALAKYDFRGKGFIYIFTLMSMMIPGGVMFIPRFEMMIELNMIDKFSAVILPACANTFGVFLMRQNMVNFPTALIEAGRIDGVGELGIFGKIVLPNVRPALGALVIYMFTGMWNSFLWPMIILRDEAKHTLPIALAVLDANPTNKDYAVVLLAAAVATLPILIIFFVFQKQFIAGVMGGAVKE